MHLHTNQKLRVCDNSTNQHICLKLNSIEIRVDTLEF